MTRFVVVSTMRRGKLEPYEPLDDAGQMAAFSCLRRDESRGIRVAFELREMDDARVALRRKTAKRTDADIVDRMLELAAKVRIA